MKDLISFIDQKGLSLVKDEKSFSTTMQMMIAYQLNQEYLSQELKL
jgi:hypothetical protein